MRILYLTNVQIPALSAQSLQIQAMAEAFSNILKDEFLLISPQNKRNKDLQTKYQWLRLATGNFLPRVLRYKILITKSLPFLLRFKPDFIFSRDIGIIFVLWILGFKGVYENHDPFETRIGKALFRLIAKKIKIIATTENLKNQMIEKYNLEEKNILVCHNGVDLGEFEKISLGKKELKKKYLKLPEDSFVCLYAGSLQKGKGVELILKVAGVLKEIFFVVIGGEEPELVELKKDAPPNLFFFQRKPHQEIPYYLKAADLLILPLKKELNYWRYTSPLKLFEYMASKTPILASNIGSLTEILNEENSFLFDPENLEDLISKLKFAKEHFLEREKRAKKAWEDVQNYTWQKRVERILKFLSYEKSS